MNRYTLDYSGPVGTGPPTPSRWPRRRMYRTFRQMGALLTALVGAIVLVGLLSQHAQIKSLRERSETQALQYDSLLLAKGEADRQLDILRAQLIKYHQP
ncbi:hypothetical protein [Spirosoma aerophilum]